MILYVLLALLLLVKQNLFALILNIFSRASKCTENMDQHQKHRKKGSDTLSCANKQISKDQIVSWSEVELKNKYGYEQMYC